MKINGINDIIFCKIQGGKSPAFKAYDNTYSVFNEVCRCCNRCTKEQEEPKIIKRRTVEGGE